MEEYCQYCQLLSTLPHIDFLHEQGTVLKRDIKGMYWWQRCYRSSPAPPLQSMFESQYSLEVLLLMQLQYNSST